MMFIFRSSIAFVMCVLWFHSANAEFRVTESQQVLLKLRERLTLEDLAIMERGIVPALGACNRNGALFVSGRNYLLEGAPSYGLVWRVQRLQGDKVTVSVSRGSDSTTSLRTSLAQAMLSAIVSRCDQDHFSSAPLYEIETINGEATSAALLVATP